jgi:hypothetical protein
MKIKTLCCAVVGAASLLTAPNLFAVVYTGTIVVNYDYGNANNGGAYTAVTSSLGTFDTFCLNSGVPFTPGVQYNFVSSDSAQPGGPGNVSTPDPISIGTAYLYSQFFNNVAGFYGTASIANDLQAAIWWLEGEALGVRNNFIDLAEAALGKDDTTIKGDANGAYGVVALNLYDANGSSTSPNKQPMLGIVPEPSTVIAGALLLLPFGVSTVRILRKNKSA